MTVQHHNHFRNKCPVHNILLVEWSGEVEGFSYESEPAPKEDVVFEAKMLIGTYYGNKYSAAGNYYILLTDNGLSQSGSELPNSTYYRLDLYAALYDGESADYVPLPVGEYTLDYNSTMAMGCFDKSYSGYWQTDDSGSRIGDEAKFESGKFVVTEQGALLTVVIDGVKHSVTFEGEEHIKNGVGSADADVNFTAMAGYAIYYGDQYTPGVANNFSLFLSDKGLDANGVEQANGTYYRFDIYTDIKQGASIPSGEYLFDETKSYSVGTFSSDMSLYYVRDASGKGYSTTEHLSGGRLVVSDSGAYAELEIAGSKHKITFNGAIDVINVEDNGGDDDGGSDDGEGDDDGGYEPPKEDIVCKLDGCRLYYECCGDFYNVGLMNWTMLLSNADMSGEYLLFDLLTNATNQSDFYGRYELNEEMGEYVLQAGKFIEDDGSIMTYGSWYFNTNSTYYLIPLAKGWLEIEPAGEKRATIEFEFHDEAGIKISGSWSGNMVSIDEIVQSSRSSIARSLSRGDTTFRSVVY